MHYRPGRLRSALPWLYGAVGDVLAGLMLAGCSVNRTVVLNDVESYAQRKTVVAVEGYDVHWNHGGRLAPAARRGLCLVEVDETTARVGEAEVPVRVLEGESGSCAAPIVRRPVSVSVEDDTLTILGRDGGVRVPTRAAYGVRVIGAKQGEVADGARHEPRSLPLVVAGLVAMLGGLGGGIAILAAKAQDTSIDHGNGPKDRVGGAEPRGGLRRRDPDDRCRRQGGACP